jgi:hypothetical protein
VSSSGRRSDGCGAERLRGLRPPAGPELVLGRIAWCFFWVSMGLLGVGVVLAGAGLLTGGVMVLLVSPLLVLLMPAVARTGS